MQKFVSKTKIKSRLSGKLNPQLVETIRLALKNEKWLEAAKVLSRPRRKKISMNLKEIDEKTKEGDTIVILGKILSQGNITKKLNVCALSISKEAKNKLKESKSNFTHLIDEIKKNPEAEGVKIIWNK